MIKSTAYLLVLALIAPWLYDRYLAFSVTLDNRPGKLQEVYNIKSHEIKFRDRIRNCEDVVLEEGMGLALLSCDPGRDKWNTVMGTFKASPDMETGGHWIYDYAHPELSDDDALKPLTLKNFDTSDFHPLGIEFEADTATLYVVNHAQPGSVIEVFKVLVQDAVAEHVQTLKYPLVHTPNSIHAIGDGKLFITNDHYIGARVSPLLSKVETFSGAPGGSVVFVDINRPETAKVVARLPFANGVTMLNSTTLAVSSTSKAGIYFYEVDADYNLTFKGYVRTPALVDNLSVDSNGKLLVAGHPFALSLMAVSKGRAICDLNSEKEEEREACGCTAPSWAAEWSEEGGLRELYKGFGYCASSMAVRDASRGLGMISALYDRGLMVFKE